MFPARSALCAFYVQIGVLSIRRKYLDATEYAPSGIAHLPAGLSPLEAATCRDPAGFEAWLAGFKRVAAANGISGAALSALDGLTYDASIVAKDHGQHVFHQSFEQFAGRMVNSYRLRKGQALMKQYANVFCAPRPD